MGQPQAHPTPHTLPGTTQLTGGLRPIAASENQWCEGQALGRGVVGARSPAPPAPPHPNQAHQPPCPTLRSDSDASPFRPDFLAVRNRGARATPLDVPPLPGPLPPGLAALRSRALHSRPAVAVGGA